MNKRRAGVYYTIGTMLTRRVARLNRQNRSFVRSRGNKGLQTRSDRTSQTDVG